MANKSLLGLSLLVHAGLAVVIGRIEVRESQAATAIEIAEVQKKKEAPPPKAEVLPEPPKEQQPRRAQRAARSEAPPPPAPPQPLDNAKPALDAMPDFGLSLSNAGPGGLAVAAGVKDGAPRAEKAPAPSVKRALSAVAAPALDDCTDPPAKPKPTSVPQPAYTEQARAAGVEGKVRVELTVDETGRVVSVRVLSGLGYGLDEAAVAAAKLATFQPAVRCGKVTRATFTISMRFSAG